MTKKNNKKEEYKGMDKNIRLSDYMDSDVLLDGEVYSPKGTEEQPLRVVLKSFEESDKFSIVSDSFLKGMFNKTSGLKYFAKLFHKRIGGISYEELVNNLRLTNSELSKDYLFQKQERADIVALIGDTYFHLEVNNNPDKESLFKSIDYAYRLASSPIRVGEKYVFHKVMTMNLCNFCIKGVDEIFDSYVTQNKNGRLLDGNINIINVYLPNLFKKYYNVGIKGLTEDERYALFLATDNKKLAMELGDGIDLTKEYFEEEESLRNNLGFKEKYDAEWDIRESERKNGLEEGEKIGIEKGLSLGRDEGRNDERMKVVKKLLINGVDKQTIMDSIEISEDVLDKIEKEIEIEN